MRKTAAALIAICALSASAKGTAGPAAQAAAPQGGAYLSPGATPDGVRILPPAPTKGSPVARADRELFAATRQLQGSPRWQVATSDVDTGPFEHFACALGDRLTAQTAPALARLLDRAGTSGVVDPVKQLYRAPRPYLGSNAPICQARTEHLAANGDYPSGHAANGWMEALILAELAPDRATEILERGRAFGESRLICGVHSRSAVEAGWLAGSAATAALHGSAEFRADLEAARIELARVRASAPAPDAAACRAEAAALAKPAY
jgi:acid phosphatase (class A)